MAGHDHAFTGLAESYQKARPTYPPEMAEALVAFAHPTLHPGAQVVDVGAGTGISTLALTQALPPGCAAIGIEPNDDMRATASTAIPAGANITFSAGNAEKLPFDDGDVALVATGQAIQWFDRPKFYAEAARVLCPAGTLAIFENNRDWRSSALLDAHEAFLETHAIRKDGSRYSRLYRDHPYAQELLRLLGNVTARQFPWAREMTVDDFITMAKSSTQTQQALQHLGERDGERLIRAYVEKRVDQRGVVRVPYVTELYMARA